MVGLVDIVPAGRSVEIRGETFTLRGVGVRGLSRLFTRFPKIAAAFQGGEVGLSDLLAVGGDAVAAIVAEGLGVPGDEVTESMVDNLTLDEVADLLEAVLAQTMPGGVVPFGERLAKLGLVLNPAGAPDGKAPASN